LIIGREQGSYPIHNNSGKVILDDVTFHDCVNLSEFELGRVMSFYPPDGEFVAMQYRLTGEFPVPFRIFPAMEETGPKSLELSVLVRAEMDASHFGANVVVEIPLPKCTATATCHILSSSGAPTSLVGSVSSSLASSSGGPSSSSSNSNSSSSSAEFVGASNSSTSSSAEKKVVWTIKKFPGASEQTIKIKVTLDKPCTSHIRRELGPIHMNFEIPMFNVSNLQVRYMRIAENVPGYTPYRWVRYVTQSSSYVCRL
jgi:AP-4 complex subunit mu-1